MLTRMQGYAGGYAVGMQGVGYAGVFSHRTGIQGVFRGCRYSGTVQGVSRARFD